MPGCEDALDRWVHRPLAAVVVRLLLPLPVSGNQVTVFRMVVGWSAAFFLYWGFFVGGPGPGWTWILAAALLFVSMVLDCVDGQLVRARGESSRTGRILDGVADILVVVVFYVVLSAGVYRWFGPGWFSATAVGGVSMWVHAVVFDRLKQLDSASGPADGEEALVRQSLVHGHHEPGSVSAAGASVKRLLLIGYAGYLKLQDRFLPPSAGRPGDPVDGKHRSGVAGTRWLGLGTHMFVLYAGVALVAVEPRSVLVGQLLFATVLNVLLVVVLVRTRAPDTAPGAA